MHQNEFVTRMKSEKPDAFSDVGLVKLFEYLEEKQDENGLVFEFDTDDICQFFKEVKSSDPIDSSLECIQVDSEKVILCQF